jgi:ribose transport system substrate-binding protein
MPKHLARRTQGRWTLALASLLLTLPLTACGGRQGARGSQARPYRIAVIPKGMTHEFWRTIHAGAIQAKRDLAEKGVHVELVWKGPLREDDREQQVQVVEGFTSQGVSGIVLAPLDDKALVRPVEDAKKLGIPTVIIDSDLASKEIVSFVATDNFKGGELAAEEMARLLGGKGKVLLLRYQEGSASTTAREEGFVTKLEQAAPGISLVSSDQYAGATRDTAKRASENLLNRFGNDLSGIFCPNESSAAGMLLALQDISKAGKIPFVGFDASQAFIDAMRSGQMQGTVLQNPFKMGALGVRTMVDHLRGRPVEKRIDTGVVLVTPKNLDDAASRDLLKPPIDEYLN